MIHARRVTRRRSGNDRQKWRKTTGRKRMDRLSVHSSVQSARFSFPV
jgi:hypothetical protein